MTRWTIKDIENLKTKKKIVVPGISANALTKHSLRVLSLKGYHVWRQNNAGVYDPGLKRFRANSSTPGISDVIGFHRKTGRFIACEIKAGKDRLSDEQIEFLKNVNESGGIGIVVRTIDDLEKFMEE